MGLLRFLLRLACDHRYKRVDDEWVCRRCSKVVDEDPDFHCPLNNWECYGPRICLKAQVCPRGMNVRR